MGDVCLTVTLECNTGIITAWKRCALLKCHFITSLIYYHLADLVKTCMLNHPWLADLAAPVGSQEVTDHTHKWWELIGQHVPGCRLGPLFLTVWVQVGSPTQCRLGPNRIFSETTFFCRFNLMYAFLEFDIGTPLVALKCAKWHETWADCCMIGSIDHFLPEK